MTLYDLKKVTEGFNALVMVTIQGERSENYTDITTFTKEELKRLIVVKVVGTKYPMYDNVVSVTVKGDLYTR